MGPFYHLILSNLGWKILLRILSGFGFLMFVSALFYRPLPTKYNRVHAESKETAKLFDLSIWKIKPFVFLVVSISLVHIGYFIPFIHLVRNRLDISKGLNTFFLNIGNMLLLTKWNLLLNLSFIADHVTATGHSISWYHFEILAFGKQTLSQLLMPTLAAKSCWLLYSILLRILNS